MTGSIASDSGPSGSQEAISGGFRDLRPLMSPRRVAIVGASRNPVRANRVINNLRIAGFDGEIYPVNPKYDEVLGLRCYPSLGAIPQTPDCAVVSIPAPGVPDVLASATAAGVPAAVIFSSGFAEGGPEGRRLQQNIERFAADGMLICGPNCYGVFNILSQAAVFSGYLPKPIIPGRIALVSQSGDFTNVVGNTLMETRGIGFSYYVSCGNQVGVSIEEYINYCVEDGETRAVGAFVEGLRRPDLLREVARKALERDTPIVMLKVGRSEAAADAVLAHSGSLLGESVVEDAALRQYGVIRVDTLDEMVETLALCSVQRFEPQDRIVVLTGSGGECGYITDLAEEEEIRLPELAAPTRQRLAGILPAFGSPRNPLDGTGTMFEDETIFPRLLDALVDDPHTGVVAVHIDAKPTPPDRPPDASIRFAREMISRAAGTDKTLIAFSPLPIGPRENELLHDLHQAGVPFVEGPPGLFKACRNLDFFQARQARAAGMQPDPARDERSPHDTIQPRPFSTAEALSLLSQWNISVVPSELARSADEASAAAARLGYPVALKVESPDVAHKTELGGVLLSVPDEAALIGGYQRITDDVRRRAPSASILGVLVQPMVSGGIEMIVGIKRDPVFGHVVLCGLGGVFVDLLEDVVCGVPPLTRDETEAMVRRLRGFSILEGYRGAPAADVPALVDAIANVARLAQAAPPELRALDINPLVVLPDGRGVAAVDAFLDMTARHTRSV